MNGVADQIRDYLPKLFSIADAGSVAKIGVELDAAFLRQRAQQVDRFEHHNLKVARFVFAGLLA